ncbi:MAG: hypothetical protein H6Q52_1093 [Deltaproteobacteria bacterium]|nr:hypothetical protein [Deltaproteobacteria bacterium]
MKIFLKRPSIVWTYFEGKDNTETIIKEKAISIASFMLDVLIDSGNLTQVSLSGKKKILMAGDAACTHLIIETLVFSIDLVMRAVSELINEEKTDIFFDSLMLGIDKQLVVRFDVESSDVEQFLINFHFICVERWKKYKKYEDVMLKSEERFGEKHALYRKFGRNITDIIDLNVDLAIDADVQCLYTCACLPVKFTRELFSLGTDFDGKGGG